VLSTGGGTVLRESNRHMLHSRGWVVYLKSNPVELFRRLRHDKTRPLLQVADPLQKLKDLYQVRDPFYREVGSPCVGNRPPHGVHIGQQHRHAVGAARAAVTAVCGLRPLPHGSLLAVGVPLAAD
jgi:shikimate kinase